MSMEPIDKANVQKFVDIFSQRHSKLDFQENELEKTLIDFTEYLAKTSPEDKDGKKPKHPYQFQLKNHGEFKKFSIPISRAMWSVPKVVIHMRTKLYEFEQSRIPMMPDMPMMQPPVVVSPNPPQKTWKEKLTSPLKAITRDPNSPHAQMLDFISNIQVMPHKWQNILHWWELGVRKRHQINTYVALQRIIDNIAIVFDAYIETNLVMVVHYANEIIKSESEDKAMMVLNAYIKAQQQNADKFPSTPQLS